MPPKSSKTNTAVTTSGRNLLEIMWELIDEATNRLLTPSIDTGDKDVGYALGLATMLATFVNPYLPDVDAIRLEAMERWEVRQ